MDRIEVRRSHVLPVPAGAPLAQSAQRAGFAVQSYITRAFRRLFGVTPGRYRELFRRS